MRRRVALLGGTANATNVALAAAWRERGIDCVLLSPAAARERPGDFDVAVARLDVLPTLDGVEPGLLELLWLERAGLQTYNPARGLLAAHDKLRTAALLERAGLPHPPTTHLIRPAEATRLPVRVVLKPRFGSWGKDVRLCATHDDVVRCVEELPTRGWFKRHGVLAQEVIPGPGYDLRLVVARGHVVGAVERHAAPGEWRTNISLGGTRRPVEPSSRACGLATRAAAAIGADLAGVDLLPLPSGQYVIVELNGAVDFDESYAPGYDVYGDVADALALRPPPGAGRRSGLLTRRADPSGRPPGTQPVGAAPNGPGLP